MLDKIKKQWSELDKKSIAWFLGSVIIILVRKRFLLGLDKKYQYILMGLGFIMLLISIYRVVFRKRQSWRDVSSKLRFIKRIPIRIGFYYFSYRYIAFLIIKNTELGTNDTKELLLGIWVVMFVWMTWMFLLDLVNLILKEMLPWMPFVSTTSFMLVFYFMFLLADSTILNLIFVGFGKMFVDMVFSNDFIFKKYFSEGTDSSPFKRLIRIKYRLYTLISSIVLVQAMRLMVPNEIKSLFRSLLYGNTEFWNRVTLSFFMMGTTIVVFLILDIIITDAIGELPISRYGRLYKSYSALNIKNKLLLWGGIILVLSYAITVIFFDKLFDKFKELLEKIKCDFQGNPLIISAITFLVVSCLLMILLYILRRVAKSAAQIYKRAKIKLRHYLVDGTSSDSQEQTPS
ncbi:hypothetical protein [uncultured Abiotrophia sp.]|uniref:hypothetical protein n=1 Tax=uncultured Abiotrophia sp. TaxID=316094 RepID=UPI0028D4C5B2|nr:hypothetical protein [uncultured Abiotrophia sp.]